MLLRYATFTVTSVRRSLRHRLLAAAADSAVAAISSLPLFSLRRLRYLPRDTPYATMLTGALAPLQAAVRARALLSQPPPLAQKS